MSSTPRKRRRGIIVLMLTLFFAPLLLSFLVYYGSNWRPLGHTNHGALIDPAHELPLVSLPRAGPDASAVVTNVFHGKWSLVYVGDGQCDSNCHDTLYFMRQTHAGLGNLSLRIQRVFLAPAHCCDTAFLKREHPDLIVLDAQGAAAATLLAQFPADRASGIFIVDPRGNLMMRYDAHADPKGLREDLKKLLDLSSIG